MNQVQPFHEGQEVEALCRWRQPSTPPTGVYAECEQWRNAKVLTVSRPNEPPQTVSVIFPDGTSGVFDLEHIRLTELYRAMHGLPGDGPSVTFDEIYAGLSPEAKEWNDKVNRR
jgi:hypothetical protein